MNKKFIYIALASCAIAFNAVSVNAEDEANSNSQESAFVCAVQGDTPTMYAYTPGDVNLTPLMSWHAEYLLPEQSGIEVCQKTAIKLQASAQQSEAKYLKAEIGERDNFVCLVNDEENDCIAEDSQKLFSVNSNYDASCVLENKSPLECKALQVRGIYSVSEEPYQLQWWPWW